MTDETAISPPEDKPDFPRDAKPWLQMLKQAEKREEEYNRRCDDIDKMYADLKRGTDLVNDRELQVFWANLQVLMPTIYSRPPVPLCAPRFRDRREVPRKAGDLIERALATDTERDKMHQKLLLARNDLARNARGVAWVIPDRNPAKARLKWLPRKDFRHGTARCWDEVSWVARAAYMTKDEYKKRFKDTHEGVEFKVRESGLSDEDKSDDTAKACVWELWHKGKGKVVWVADGAKEIADVAEPWVELDDFWPCPQPAYGTVKPETLIPVPDATFYQDQLAEINDLTDRIAKLMDALRLKGFYAAGSGDIGTAIEIAMADTDNRALMVPVSNFAALGGARMSDSIVWMPIDMVISALQGCIEGRKTLMQDVYEITGLSDIMRGATEAQETLGAQQLKAQFGSVRVRERQGEMQRLARDVYRIKAEIMAEHYEPKTLMDMAQIDDLPTKADLAKRAQGIQQQAQQAIMGVVQQAMQAAQQQPQQAPQQAPQQPQGPMQ